MTVIDAHGHLGDLLYPGGGALIGRRGVAMERVWDPQALGERGLNRNYGLGRLAAWLLAPWNIRAQRARNFTATLENMRRSLDEAGVDFAVCLPVAPHVTFADLARARRDEPRIIPFTSVDFTRADPAARIADDVRQGARGLKLHPIIQGVSLADRRTLEALQAFAPFHKPVLVHAGPARYYPSRERNREIPGFGRIRHLEQLVRTFPGIDFIAGHAGLLWVDEVSRKLRGLPNVWVETSFQSPRNIRKLIAAFGPDRVLFGSDWPFGSRLPHLRAVRTACHGDRSLEERLLHANARELLGLQ